MILITGAAGYIGSHLILRLLNEYHDVIGYDNLSKSTMINLSRIYKNYRHESGFYFVNGDILDELKLERIFKKYNITKVVHLAGFKSISESYDIPQEYHRVNVLGSQIVLRMAVKYGVQTVIFGSTAAVYAPLPIGRYSEKSAISGHSSPYSNSKLETEKLLLELKKQDMTIDIVILRYFNPVGVDESGILVLENIESTNLFPNIMTHLRDDSYLTVYGNDYLTFDGTAIRDYIHVNDLIDVHMLMIDDVVLSNDVRIFNVGSDNGYSVKEIIEEFNKQLNRPVKCVYKERRKGDAPLLLADTTKLKTTFNWQPKYTLPDMVRTTLMANSPIHGA